MKAYKSFSKGFPKRYTARFQLFQVFSEIGPVTDSGRPRDAGLFRSSSLPRPPNHVLLLHRMMMMLRPSLSEPSSIRRKNVWRKYFLTQLFAVSRRILFTSDQVLSRPNRWPLLQYRDQVIRIMCPVRTQAVHALQDGNCAR